MPAPFVNNEAAFTPTAKTLKNLNPNQGASFSTWPNPDRKKINQALACLNEILSVTRGL